ncbi:hypothetical protein QBC43DRAFT_265083 [Cladorrhinum sp. PSN259]|nr:hypothetical protein QBC43DRAFT_265083 [Cladorrhinum sp. PSN259]
MQNTRTKMAARQRNDNVRLPEAPPPLEATVTGIEIAEDGSISTFRADLSAISASHPGRFGITARIFVIVGDGSLMNSLGSWIGQDSQPWHGFVKAHLEDDGNLQRELSDAAGANVFFASWWRTEEQEEHQYWIQRRIRANKPYSVDTPDDPWTLHLDHERYSHWPNCPHRPYHVISAPGARTTGYHAAQECMSYYRADVDGVMTYVLLEDPIRYHDVVDIRFDFWTTKQTSERKQVLCFRPRDDDRKKNPQDEEALKGKAVAEVNKGKFDEENPQIEKALSDKLTEAEKKKKSREEGMPTSKFIRALEKYDDGRTAAQNPAKFVKMVIAELICEDLSGVLRSMSRVLDTIELDLHNDIVLQESMPMWREQLGKWRNALFHQSGSLERVAEDLATKGDGLWDSSVRPSRAAVATDHSPEHRPRRRIERLEEDLNRTSRRIETTFQALMSSITIVESERAIKEAESVSKLTQLAFFFIPLSLVSSVFGMNINEFEGQLTWWHWVLVSVAASIFTYTALYWKELLSSLLALPGLIRSLSVKNLSRLAVRWLKILSYVVSTLPLVLVIGAELGLLAGLSIATWQLAKSHLPTAAQAAIGVFVIWLPVTAPAAYYHFVRRARSRPQGSRSG